MRRRWSEYPIQASEDIKVYLAKELGGDPKDYAKIRIPDNTFVWATMNSADQGVFFKNKVIMHLFDDAAKQKRPSLFAGCRDKNKNLYSQICREFDTKGVYIFCEAISSQFIDNVPEDDGE